MGGVEDHDFLVSRRFHTAYDYTEMKHFSLGRVEGDPDRPSALSGSDIEYGEYVSAMDSADRDITRLLRQMTAGDKNAEERLAEAVYPELRRLAAIYMSSERAGHTLQATAVVHEAFLRLKGVSRISWQNRSHFFSVMAKTMRRVLVDHARGFRAGKRAGYASRIPLDAALVYAEEQSDDLLALDEALTRLALLDSRQARVVEMRFFAGLEMEQIAAVLGVSSRTAKRDFSMARAWLYGELAPDQDHGRGNLEPS
jgi:RNA polymerase sigma factor (TIGR02999 family)